MSISVPFPAPAPAVSRAGPVPREREQERAERRPWPWQRLGLLAILALSAVLELWHLDRLGTSNAFYAAAVLSMRQNWHAFFFNSLDAVGFVTIDKPPLGFWVQVLFAKLLGFSGTSILLPEALATVGSVALVYQLVKRAFGAATGLLAGLGLALVPISVVVGRNNTIDALLVLTLLGAVWTTLRATARGSLTWLLASGAIVGLGFEIKMLEAYLVVPALGLVYLLAAPISRRARLIHLTLAALVMLAVSLAWPLTVDLTPATLRPWVDSTQNNSAISLALGYNGIQRLLGQRESLSQFLSGLGLHLGAATSASSSTSDGFGGAGGGLFNNGPVGVVRLFDQQLAGQASWLLPLALVGTAAAMWQTIKQRHALASSRQAQTGLVFGVWLLAAGAFFSVANFFHSYYLVTLGPPVGALAAIGVWAAWRAWRTMSRLAWLLPACLLGTALVQAHILSDYPGWSGWLVPVVLGGTALGTLGLLGAWLTARRASPGRRSGRLARAAVGLALVSLLVAPGVWSGYSTLYASSGGIPSAGPQVASTAGGPGGFSRDGTGGANPSPADGQAGGQPGGFGGGPGGEVSTALVSYLDANQGIATYLAATTNSNTAASLILAAGQPVMSLGGFSGDDPILTVDQFAQLVAAGQVRYVLLGGPGGGSGPGQPGSSSAIVQWVEANGTLVPSSALGTSSAQQTQLYDLTGAA